MGSLYLWASYSGWCLFLVEGMGIGRGMERRQSRRRGRRKGMKRMGTRIVGNASEENKDEMGFVGGMWEDEDENVDEGVDMD